MHLDAEQVERLLHDELDQAIGAELRAHLLGCALCERRVATAAREEAEIGDLLRRLDHPAPALRADALIGRAHRARSPLRRIAAGIALAVVVASAAYALPGSPLPHLVQRAVSLVTPTRAPAPPAPLPFPAAPAGIAVRPGADFTIVFTAEQALGTATVRVVDSPELSVRASGGPVSFDLGIDRVTVSNAGAAASYEILVPRDAPSVRIQVGSAVLWRKPGAPGRDTHTLPLRAPAP